MICEKIYNDLVSGWESMLHIPIKRLMENIEVVTYIVVHHYNRGSTCLVNFRDHCL